MNSTSISCKPFESPLLSRDYPKAFEDIPEGSYYNPETKLYHCEKCHVAKQCEIVWMGTKHTVQCMCDCEKTEYDTTREEQDKRNREAEKRHNRFIALEGTQHDKTFEHSDIDEENELTYKICKKYADEFEKMKSDNIGLKLYGEKGNGKSHFSACIANQLVDNGYHVYMRTMDQLINEVQCSRNKNETIGDICSYDLLIIDEFGSERGTETAVQYVYDIINSRLVSGKPFIITTNLAHPDESAMSIEQKRIYSRFSETLIPIRCKGRDRRDDIQADKKEKFKKFLEGIK